MKEHDDLKYSRELHDSHNDYPLAPRLPKTCETIRDRHKISMGKVFKLVTTLMDEKNYVLHYRNLRLYDSLGLKVTKVHRVLEFDQSPWLKVIYRLQY